MSARERVNHVQLSGIPTYRQGTHDGLCVYYSAAMMLAALYPYMDSWFGESTAEIEHGKSYIVYRWTPDQLWEDVERLFSPTNM